MDAAPDSHELLKDEAKPEMKGTDVNRVSNDG